MAQEIKLTGPSMEQRITNRLRSSGENSGADVHVVKGEGPTRTHTHIHHSASHGTRIDPNPSMDQGRDILGGYGPESPTSRVRGVR